jgi:hypothetical protein
MLPLEAVTAWPRQLVTFQGAVQCGPGEGAVNVVLSGSSLQAGAARAVFTQLLFSSATLAVPLPAMLHQVQVSAISAHRFHIRGLETQVEFVAHSAQLQRDAGAAFYAAVPPQPVTAGVRGGWALLLMALRLPGAGALIRFFRGGSA